MSIGDKLKTITENDQKVYDSGYENGKADQKKDSVDWDIIQNYGNRIYYPRAFGYWGLIDISPKHIVAPTGNNFVQAFQGSYARNIDWSKFDLSQCASFSEVFNSCPYLLSIDTDLAPTSTASNVWNYTFGGAQKLKRIQKMVTKLTHQFLSSFAKCYELEEIRFAPYDAENGIGIGNDISFAD